MEHLIVLEIDKIYFFFNFYVYLNDSTAFTR